MDKKHVSQLTQSEFQAIWIRLKGIKPTFSQHAIERMADKGIAQSCITGHVKLIEFNRHNGDSRALLRQSDGICYSVSLISGEIITVYYNVPSDNHSTIDWTQYNTSLPVAGW